MKLTYLLQMWYWLYKTKISFLSQFIIMIYLMSNILAWLLLHIQIVAREIVIPKFLSGYLWFLSIPLQCLAVFCDTLPIPPDSPWFLLDPTVPTDSPLIPHDSSRSFLIPHDSSWFPSDSPWFLLIPSDSSWFLLIPRDSSWFLAIPLWFPLIP